MPGGAGAGAAPGRRGRGRRPAAVRHVRERPAAVPGGDRAGARARAPGVEPYGDVGRRRGARLRRRRGPGPVRGDRRRRSRPAVPQRRGRRLHRRGRRRRGGARASRSGSGGSRRRRRRRRRPVRGQPRAGRRAAPRLPPAVPQRRPGRRGRDGPLHGDRPPSRGRDHHDRYRVGHGRLIRRLRPGRRPGPVRGVLVGGDGRQHPVSQRRGRGRRAALHRRDPCGGVGRCGGARLHADPGRRDRRPVPGTAAGRRLRDEPLLREPRRRDVRGADRGGRSRPGRERHGRRRRRLRRRRDPGLVRHLDPHRASAAPVRRHRQQALPEPGRRHVPGDRRGRQGQARRLGLGGGGDRP